MSHNTPCLYKEGCGSTAWVLLVSEMQLLEQYQPSYIYADAKEKSYLHLFFPMAMCAPFYPYVNS